MMEAFLKSAVFVRFRAFALEERGFRLEDLVAILPARLHLPGSILHIIGILQDDGAKIILAGRGREKRLSKKGERLLSFARREERMEEEETAETEREDDCGDSVAAYFREAARERILTKEEEEELFLDIEDAEKKILRVICLLPDLLENFLDMRHLLAAGDIRLSSFTRLIDSGQDCDEESIAMNRDGILRLMDKVHSSFMKNRHEYEAPSSQRLPRLVLEWERLIAGILPKQEILQQALGAGDETLELLREADLSADKDPQTRAFMADRKKLLEKRTACASSDYAAMLAQAAFHLQRMERLKSTAVSKNLRLVISVVRRRGIRHVGHLSFLDLVQEGNIGLIKAVEKFNVRLGNRFSTYATWWISQAMDRGAKDMGYTIRLPIYIRELANRLAKEAGNFQIRNGREPRMEELAARLDIPAWKVMLAMSMRMDAVSLDVPVGDDEEGATRGDFVADSRPGVQDAHYRAELSDKIAAILAQLPAREEEIIRRRFGIGKSRSETLEEIGLEFRLTRERIRQIEAKAMRKLKKGDRGRLLLSLYNEIERD